MHIGIQRGTNFSLDALRVKPELRVSSAICQTQARRVISKSGIAFSLNISDAFNPGSACWAIKPRYSGYISVELTCEEVSARMTGAVSGVV